MRVLPISIAIITAAVEIAKCISVGVELVCGVDTVVRRLLAAQVVKILNQWCLSVSAQSYSRD
jgi:hypothetical protein